MRERGTPEFHQLILILIPQTRILLMTTMFRHLYHLHVQWDIYGPLQISSGGSPAHFSTPEAWPHNGSQDRPGLSQWWHLGEPQRKGAVPTRRNFWRIPRVMRIPLLWSSRNHTSWSPKRKAKATLRVRTKEKPLPSGVKKGKERKDISIKKFLLPLEIALDNHLKKANYIIRENQTKPNKQNPE